MFNVKDILKGAGFRYESTCYCNGTKTEKWKKNDWQVVWQKHRMMFKMKKHGVSFSVWLRVQKLKTFLDELPTQIIVAQTAMVN